MPKATKAPANLKQQRQLEEQANQLDLDAKSQFFAELLHFEEVAWSG